VPPKRRLKAWRQLREWVGEYSVANLERAAILRVRRLHHLEREIAKLAAMPKNEGRAKAILLLKKKLAEL
jgi:hypothetical protein